MTLRQYLAWLAIGTLVSWGALVLVMTYLNPQTAGTTGFLFFYLSLFLSLGGTFTLVGFAWRYWRHRDEVLFRHVSMSFRQGILLALAVVLASWLKTNNLLTWWNTGLLVVGLTLLELFWLSVRRQSPPI
ncbi:MAG: hypothetical protein UV57_C0050G0005 [Parcubacteria group bacterium GW2011_GWD2_43_10]|uniref:Uncharacterized protein n=4 Tax=Candidatus Vebleniibacteriota TaxID=1817921 RepID=A0A1G2Q602_9BACT|nr:MAG: hypothetical protein UV57_C0050G0005 [Parcubacteria group bacterium GW2011_GWD2_43_10]KKS92786.1 MAG: hypothetical protein UV69_C0022G0017 [Parcubacteria group bacterium GW2011_GWE2_43_12]OHA54508.1 MAG: hypothetical protein A2226_01715 [Candidatus Veblenbacteria bacterium RIFOXYA2_FULL_43_9]OHA55100.1 MAG: hypothetical protein A2388_01315 [Candidatus Veblenbacteria bacterium RIFOXYB1_FULL_43_13]OHA55975.1 MAG: hypothetical protein A2429_01875 [Candidatus Veblenbacteria bacterium RIFOXY